jgi:hypothetical protein
LRPANAANAATKVAARSLTTPNFDLLSGQHPWIADTRLSVGKVHCVYGTGPSYWGCGVMVGPDMIAVAQHETEHQAQLRISFALPDNTYSEPIPITSIDEIPGKDLAFGRIDPAMVEKYGLRPISWAEKTMMDQGKILVGFAGGYGSLDALLGRRPQGIEPYSYTDPDTHRMSPQIIQCNAESFADMEHGKSGCPIFNLDGGFAGICKGKGTDTDYLWALENKITAVPETIATFTPVEGVWDEYARRYPDKAAHAHMQNDRIPLPPGDPSCRSTFPVNARPR